ncbi:MAG TPA: tRNA lysidine(34) synthetase TilS [Anaerolineaceae bacterium]|nr:tRNA lysidine(34) synthetase TilS [Anaerolineaceae bacterium]HPN52719.1 tRNA lysidine(34) synthetase TilS [Anaerolineaceae bacterium]
MLNKIKTTCIELCSLNLGQPVVVGVSGGADSLCLLDCLSSLNYNLIVGHFNHHLRPGSNIDASLVEIEAKNRGLPFILGEGDVAAYAEEQSLSIEEAARLMRYQFLFSQARQHQAQAVAVAHNADDQVETMLMHLLRGAGLAGLRGMRWRTVVQEWDAEIPLVRPMLGIWRDEIMAYCQDKSLSPVEDVSNKDTTFYRNRLRHELIPYLKSYNPQIKHALWRTTEVLSGDEAVIEAELMRGWNEHLLQMGEGYLVFDAQWLAGLMPGLKRAWLRKAVYSLAPGLRNLDQAAVERGRNFLEDFGRQRCGLPGGLDLVREGGKVYLSRWDAELPVSNWPQMEPPARQLEDGILPFSETWQIEINRMPETNEPIIDDPFSVMLDLDEAGFPLFLRTRQPGDRFKPMGMNGHSQKLADFFINQRLPQRARAGWPLLCNAAGEIIWIPGFRPAHSVRINTKTKRTVLVRVTLI